KVRSVRYRGLGFKIALGLFVIALLVLGHLGGNPPTPGRNLVARICAVIYFGYFVFLWVYTFFGLERTKPEPERLTKNAAKWVRRRRLGDRKREQTKETEPESERVAQK
ncbi:MAG: cytochrome b, partial [Nitrococcus sp.]|nr:cytochrome b [Nitrococcus sp.]